MWMDVVNFAVWKTILLSALSFTHTATELVSLKTYFVEDWNDKVLNMYEKGIHDMRLKLSRTGAGAANYEMSVVTSQEHLLSIRILDLTMGTCSAKLSLYNQQAIPSQAIAVDLCENSTTEYHTTEFHTRSPQLVVSFQSLLYIGSLNNNFNMLITSYKPLNDSTCGSGYFDCTNNRCIDTALVCNTRNNCGNDLDENQSCSSTWSNAVLITVAVFCLALVISIYLYKSKRCTRDRLRRLRRTAARRINVRPKHAVAPKPSTQHQSPRQHPNSTAPNMPIPSVLQDQVGGSVAPGYTAHPSNPGTSSANPAHPQQSQPSSAGYQVSPPAYQEQSTGYQEQSTGYQDQPPIYQEQQTVYQEHQSGYQYQSQGYQEQVGYQDPNTGYQDQSGYQYENMPPSAGGYQADYQASGGGYGQPLPSAPPPPSGYQPTADNPPYYQPSGY